MKKVGIVKQFQARSKKKIEIVIFSKQMRSTWNLRVP